MKTVRISVPDMACGHCAKTVEEALRSVEGVGEVEVSLESKEALVRASENVAEDSLASAVKGAGYSPEF